MFFSPGAGVAVMPMGEGVGKQITCLKKFPLPCRSFSARMITTIAEPDLQVLAGRVPSVPNMTLILTVAGGVGCFLAIAMLRPLFKINLT